MRFNIREKRLAAGLTQEDMADRLEISTGLYNGLEKGKRRMNETYMEGIANILGVAVSDLIIEDRPTIAIAGKVGAGAQVPVFDAYEKGDGPQVECPPGLSPRGVVAVEVEGDSMEPVYSAGDLLFYTRDSSDGVPGDVVGHRCVCEDADGMGWVKQVKAGDEPGLFHLISLNPTGSNAHNVQLIWAARVRLHWPAELARKT
ncbi:XRE family transcriptional regulator [Phaeobacter inhibens]|uniref:XRE family transcriptional regulator n=1 Tax=Phaeobacter inhibens TaxID=221822 RepID=UPI000CA0E141|nr:XRE family transcriptional regulator [Phaeobacter inhibens]AUQ64410.1 putative transcriptional regulator [Phaeobacter inhibens]AUQ89848.1 putative transcriptional regulator [Phaeobacter inhibens]